MRLARVRFRYRLTLRETGEVFYARTRRAVRFARLLWSRNGGRIKVTRCIWEKRSRALHLVAFWGPTPKHWKGYTVLLQKLWVTSDSLARIFAFHWELRDRRNIADFERADRYLKRKREIPCPHSSEHVPF